MVDVSGRVATVRHAWEGFLESGREPEGVRPSIAASWRRSQLSGVAPEGTEFPYRGGETQSRLVAAATPVLSRFAMSLPGTDVSVVLADRRARIVGRWVGDAGLGRQLTAACIDRGFVLGEDVAGTNGIGTVFEELHPVEVVGPEHYASRLHELTCVGMPIRHPLSSRLEGVLDLACPTTESNRLLLPTVIDLGAQIERELFERTSDSERSMLRAFLARNQKTTRPVIALSEKAMMTNAAAAPWLDGADQAFLLEQADLASLTGDEVVRELTFPGGRTATARCRPVRSGLKVAGVLIEIDDRAAGCTRRLAGPAREQAHDLLNGGLVGQSEVWRRVAQRCATLTANAPIRIDGERGVGKMALARYLHHRLRPDSAYSVLAAGLEQVLGTRLWLRRVYERLQQPAGTVVLGHVEQLSEAAAAALCDLLDLVAEYPPLLISTLVPSDRWQWRPLYDRLGAQVLTVPPLRERTEDIPAIVDALLRRHTSGGLAPRVTPPAVRVLIGHLWPGNVRELEALLTQLIGDGHIREITPADLPDLGRAARLRHRLGQLQILERDAIIKALRDAEWNKTQAAATLGMSRSGLYRKLRQYGIGARTG